MQQLVSVLYPLSATGAQEQVKEVEAAEVVSKAAPRRGNECPRSGRRMAQPSPRYVGQWWSR